MSDNIPRPPGWERVPEYLRVLVDTPECDTQTVSPPPAPFPRPSGNGHDPQMTDIQRARAYVAKVPGAGQGERNQKLNGLAYGILERFHLSEDDHRALCVSWAGTCSPPLPEQECVGTIRSAWNGCLRKGQAGSKRTEPRMRSHAPAAHDSEPPPDCATEEPTETVCDWEPDSLPAQPPPKLTAYRPRDLIDYDTEHDPDCLLGRRWICRGGAALWVGQAGLGKSALLMQAACLWGLGLDLFGIAPVRPLKSLIIQSENDRGDMAEAFKGVVNGLGLASRMDELQERVCIVAESAQTGKDAVNLFRWLAMEHRPDLFWIDPLLSFLGGDVSSQETVSGFLRNGLTPISQEYGLAWLIMHHTGKPPKDPTLRNGTIGQDYSYLGTGSSELANWPRAVVTLRETEEERFELRTAKRGKRAGMIDNDGNFATSIPVQHGAQNIVWERARGNSELLQVQVSQKVNEVLLRMDTETSYRATQLVGLVQAVFGYPNEKQVYKGFARTIYNAVQEQTRCSGMPNLFRKTTGQVAR